MKRFALPSLFGCALLAHALFGAAPARADNPNEARNDKLAARVVALGRSPKAVLPLLELWSNWDDSTPSHTRSLIEKLATDKRLAPPTREMALGLLADANTRLGDVRTPDARSDERGYISVWRVIGPFDNEGKSGLDSETPPERDRLLAPDLQASYAGRERPVSWRSYPEVVRRSYVSFGALMRPRDNVCGLAETFVYTERARPLALFIGSGGANKVYWNGQQVFQDSAYRLPSPDRSAVMVDALKGANRVLVKVCITSGAWGFHLRLGEADGSPASELRVQTTSDHALDIVTNPKAKLPKAPLTPLVFLEAEAAAKKPSAEALANLARYLRATGADDPAERRAGQLSARAVELAPTLEHIQLAADLAEQRGDIMGFAAKAEKLFPDEGGSLLLRARVKASGPAPEDALPLLKRIPQRDESWTTAQLLQASVLRDLGLPLAARRVAEELRKRVGDAPRVLQQLADLYNASGAAVASMETRQRLLALRFDDTGSRRVLIADALQRGATTEVLTQLEAFSSVSKGSVDSLLYIAGVYDGLGRDDLALAMYREAMDLAPESTEALVAYGRALLRADRADLAGEAFTRALALKPQDAETRELLEQIKTVPRSDEAYAVPSETLLAARRDSSGYPKTVLSDLTVSTVFENGLGSKFHQHAVQVHDKEGARQYRTYGIQYDPVSQRVDVRLARVTRKDGRALEAVRTYEQQLGEPWYRIYYDTRARVIVFPDLEPGDVVEVRYRIDDIAHRNVFANYYGDLHTLQGNAPILRSEYILVTPQERKFYVKEPKLAGMAHTQSVADGRRVDRYLAQDIPAIVAEDGMPGPTEASSYLHVSTYQSWQDVARWYWGLIKDQLYADEALKRTVRELMLGATSTQQKVERIHHWVVTHTRYVGLEFGIHGFLPYRVPLIVQRGFGDCKDKASLLYTMLREAGVDARIVLVRTRRNGAIASEPASLAVFDHAIAYVPDLNLYIDGTAEHSGTRELPVQDQGVTVLVVGPQGGELRQTPVLEAELGQRNRTLRVELATDGSAKVEGDELVSGSEAAAYREYYAALGTRAERFERSLSAQYPGLKLEAQDFQALDDLEKPVRYSYRIAVPELARWEGDELRLAPSVLRDLVHDLARLPKRHHTLELAGRSLYVEERNVRVPNGMRSGTLPQGGEASSEFGRLKLAFAQRDGSITAHTELRLNQDRIAPHEYPAFRRWVEAADELLKQRIGLRKDQD